MCYIAVLLMCYIAGLLMCYIAVLLMCYIAVQYLNGIVLFFFNEHLQYINKIIVGSCRQSYKMKSFYVVSQ